MKKQLKDELVSLAKKITYLEEEDRVSSGELKELAKQLYEKLTVLHFTESNIFSNKHQQEEQEEKKLVKTAVEVKAPAEKKVEKKVEKKKEEPVREPDDYAPTGLEFNDAEAITEPNTEKIKDIVAQMPAETRKVDDLFAHVSPKNYQKKDMEDLGGVHYDHLPQFEPLGNKTQQEKPKSLNDRLKKGINIGVNDRHAFVRHLFDGSNSDYNRVLSQLSTIRSKEEAINFIANMVKPDYNNWEGKEEYESRFLGLVEKRYE